MVTPYTQLEYLAFLIIAHIGIPLSAPTEHARSVPATGTAWIHSVLQITLNFQQRPRLLPLAHRQHPRTLRLL